MTPSKIIAALKLQRSFLSTIKPDYHDVFDDALASLDEAIGEIEAAYQQYRDTDWKAELDNAAIELREDQRNER